MPLVSNPVITSCATVLPNVPGTPATGTPANRRGFANRAVLIGVPVTLLVAVIAGSIAWRVHVGRRAAMYEALIAQTREHLQLAENNEALSVLSSADDVDAPPEYRYLRAITLARLGRQDAANAEIRQAIEAVPNNPKYKGLELKYRLFAKERSAIDQLIELHRQYASMAEVALFAVYAFQAREVLLSKEHKTEAAEFHHQQKVESLNTALTLAGEMPEFFPELLLFSIQEDRHREALELLDGQNQLRPKSLEIRGRRISTLMALHRADDAAVVAAEMFEESDRNVDAAVYYASTLAQTSRTDDHDQAFAKLVQTYPTSTEMVSKYGIYLARSNRLREARDQIEKSMKRQVSPEARQNLAFVAVTLPLELNAPGLADEELKKYRTAFQDEILIKYFQARILYLRSQHEEAAKLMIEIVRKSRTQDGKATALAEDALLWVRQILQDAALSRHLKSVAAVAEESEKTNAKPDDLKVVDDGKPKPPTDATETTDKKPTPDAPAGATAAPAP